MAYVWGVLAAIQPAFQTVTDASDPGIRALMKLPASLADIGLALLALYALRDRLAWGVTAAVAILLLPAVFDVSAWWGQYESIYLLFALAAVVFALNDRDGLAAAALALALMTKPQALPFLVPFAAWFWARGGPRGFVTAAAVGLGVIVLVWLPFIPAGGPANYLETSASTRTTSSRSCRSGPGTCGGSSRSSRWRPVRRGRPRSSGRSRSATSATC